MHHQKKVFALDIGTRSVVGIILEECKEHYQIVDIYSKEHDERSMLDGQIHDVLSVSKVISHIKEHLEQKHGPLKRVCVAAAGRSLKTKKAQALVNIHGKPMMTKQDVQHLELTAVQHAQASVAKDHQFEKSHHYDCVGYSVLYYRLDGEEIGNLIDQQGTEASVEVIATFLPKTVVESLLSALTRAELEMEALTLEPIAAINVLIPSSMRRLNLALVDIGAGTSDIAITNEGTVIAYGMVPIAGDEITEALCDSLLLDFSHAEKVKKELSEKSSIMVSDVLGFKTELPREMLIEKISPTVDLLTEALSREILALNNNKAPKAVMLIGGGSLTPKLSKQLANKLALPENRVAIRGIDAIRSLSFSEEIPRGPELVTPLGIALTAKESPVQYKTAYVNNLPIHMFEINKLTVGDCLLASGISIENLYGKPGRAMFITLNGHPMTIPGLPGEPPRLQLNERASSFDDEVANGDRIIVITGKDGSQAALQIKDLLDDIPLKNITINGKQYEIHGKLTCNQKSTEPSKFIENKDNIELQFPERIEELFDSLKLHDLLEEIRPFKIKINNRDTFLPPHSGKILCNGIEVKPFHKYEDLDSIEVCKRVPMTVKQFAQIKKLALTKSIPVTFNGKRIQIVKKATEIYRGSNLLTGEDLIEHGDELIIKETPIEAFIFQDIFKHVQIQIPKDVGGGQFVLLRNGNKVTYHDQIESGDSLRIIWQLAPKS